MSKSVVKINFEALPAILVNNEGHAYHKIMQQCEGPMLEQVMIICRGNQTRASEVLGINRGTLRKKLLAHGLISGPVDEAA